MTSEFRNDRFPGWAAVIGMAICPLIGVFAVSLTTWKSRTKLVVAIVGSALWIAMAIMIVRNSHAGPSLLSLN